MHYSEGLDYILRNASDEYWNGRGWISERALAQGFWRHHDATQEADAVVEREPDTPQPITIKMRWGCERTPITIDRKER